MKSPAYISKIFPQLTGFTLIKYIPEGIIIVEKGKEARTETRTRHSRKENQMETISKSRAAKILGYNYTGETDEQLTARLAANGRPEIVKSAGNPICKGKKDTFMRRYFRGANASKDFRRDSAEGK
jgi:hypothetical protein